MSTHTSFPKRTKVNIIMRDGKRFTDRFLDKKSGRVHFEDSGWMKVNTIRSMTIWRGETTKD